MLWLVVGVVAGCSGGGGPAPLSAITDKEAHSKVRIAAIEQTWDRVAAKEIDAETLRELLKKVVWSRSTFWEIRMEALKAAGLSEDSDVFKRAIVFLRRCQNSGENDSLGSENKDKSTGDGGFYYAPGETKAETIQNADGTISYSSYGSMTYAGLKSYVYAGLSKDHPLVAQAWEWIQKNYTVIENPDYLRTLGIERASPISTAAIWQSLMERVRDRLAAA